MTERLLIVEDEDTLCRSLQRVLSNEGYEVDIADSAETAGVLLESKSYDLVIVDIILPGISGIELLTKHRKTHFSQKMVVITAHASMETAVAAIKAGACDYITKPLMHDELKRVVRRALEKPG
jgi:DNA-binding NtrC family response regulator